MKFSLDRDELLALCDAAALAAQPTGATPEMASLHLAADADVLTVTGYDGVMWSRASRPFAPDRPGVCLLPAHEFRRWLKAVPNGLVHLAVGKSIVRTDSADGKVDWPLLDPVAYPLPRTSGEPPVAVTVPAAALAGAVTRATAGLFDRDVNTDGGQRYEGKGLILSLAGHLSAVCCFSSGMSVATVGVDAGEHSAEEMIPPRAVAAVKAVLVGAEAVDVAVSRAEAVVRAPGREVGTRLVAGRRPPWAGYLTHMRDRRGPAVAIDPAAWQVGVRQALAAAAGQFRVKLDFSESAVHVSVARRSSVRVPVADCPIRGSLELGADTLTRFLDAAKGSAAELAVVEKDGTPQAVHFAAPGWDFFCMCLGPEGG